MEIKRKRQQGKPGFTLVELLVVISIIALLLAVLMPALGKAREAAKVIVCESNNKQIGMLFALYQQEYKGAFPPYYNQLTENTYWYWVSMISAFDKKWVWGGVPPKYFFCQSQKTKYVFEGSVSYGYNYFKLGNVTADGPQIVKAMSVKNPAAVLMLAETRWTNFGNARKPDDLRGMAVVYPPGPKSTGIFRSGVGSKCEQSLANRHPLGAKTAAGSIAVLWADNHVTKETRGPLYTDIKYWGFPSE